MEQICNLIKELELATDSQLIFLRYLIEQELINRRIIIKKINKKRKKEN